MRKALFAAALLALSGTASAASLTLLTSTPTRAPGQQLVVTVRGTGFDQGTPLTSDPASGFGTYGGDFSVAFNNVALQFVSLVVSNPPFDTSSINSSSAASLGLIDRVDVFRAAGAPAGPDFDIATITFNVLAGFVAPTSITLDASLVGWSQPDGLTAYNLNSSYGLPGLLVSPVPAPPAVWLLATGIAGLVARRKLRTA